MRGGTFTTNGNTQRLNDAACGGTMQNCIMRIKECITKSIGMWSASINGNDPSCPISPQRDHTRRLQLVAHKASIVPCVRCHGDGIAGLDTDNETFHPTDRIQRRTVSQVRYTWRCIKRRRLRAEPPLPPSNSLRYCCCRSSGGHTHLNVQFIQSRLRGCQNIRTPTAPTTRNRQPRIAGIYRRFRVAASL